MAVEIDTKGSAMAGYGSEGWESVLGRPHGMEEILNIRKSLVK